MTLEKRGALVIRLAPGGDDRLQLGLKEKRIFLGWSDARGLLNPDLSWEQFRQIVKSAHYADDTGNRRSGIAAGFLWQFIHSTKRGDYAVVPYGDSFYVGEITGCAEFKEENTSDAQGEIADTAYSRNVEWLNHAEPIPRSVAGSALRSRMKTRGSAADATDLVSDIEIALDRAASGTSERLEDQLRERLVASAVDVLRAGETLIDEREFERLVASVFTAMGANTLIPARQVETGDDVVATFPIVDLKVIAQVKYHRDPNIPTDVTAVQDVERGIERHDHVHAAWVVTAGEFSQEAEDYAENSPAPIRLVNGEDLARMIVDLGVRLANLNWGANQ